MKFRYDAAHEGDERIGIDPGVLDLHNRPLVPASIVPADSERARFVVEAGKEFLIDHTDGRLQPLCDWLRSNSKQFVCLSREALPRKVANPSLSAEPHRHYTNTNNR